MRRLAPAALLTLAMVVLGSYVYLSRRVVVQLQREAAQEGVMYANIYRALTDTSESETSATAALLDLSRHITRRGVPVVVTDAEGRPTAAANLPFEVGADPDQAQVREYVARLDAENPPVTAPGVGTVHYGYTPLVQRLRVIPVLQALLIGSLIAAAVYALRTRGRAEREKTWAGMAREAAHQLGTPLSSLSGWVELLSEREGDGMTASAVTHMRGDLARLDRVANRFERIGHPPRRDEVDVAELARNICAYFRERAPTLAHTVRVVCQQPDGPVMVHGDAVLLEWAIEALVKNALDALAGRGGTVTVSVEQGVNGDTRVRVADDGPGVPREFRARVFEPGFTTKRSGWGIGLSLAKRIVEENHLGRLVLAPMDQGASFDIILPT